MLVKYSTRVIHQGKRVDQADHQILGYNAKDCARRAARKWFNASELRSAVVIVETREAKGSTLGECIKFEIEFTLDTRIIAVKENSLSVSESR